MEDRRQFVLAACAFIIPAVVLVWSAGWGLGATVATVATVAGR